MKIFQFNNRFVEQLPGDPHSSVVPRQVSQACYSEVKPSQVRSAKVACVSEDIATLLGLSIKECRSNWFAQAFVGNQLLKGMRPFAMCYGGHQFGHWAGQLGDGRAINLGEVIDQFGQNQTLQLKGAGLTPYSRTADGLAVLRSSIREFLCSEAMFHLGIATTRALSLILTGEKVLRDMFYDGNPELEPGAVVCRVSPSFVRFGSFEIFAAREQIDVLKQLMDFTIKYDFPHLGKPCVETYERWFDEVCCRTSTMIVHWMRVGFVHGVMNTDNMSILGLTIDYGPYGWMEGYDPKWTPNTTDATSHRYCYERQPEIAQWNLHQLANAIIMVIGRTESLEKSLQDFANTYALSSQKMYANKLGLEQYRGSADNELIDHLFETMMLTETDMTLFFRSLAKFKLSTHYTDLELIQVVEEAFYEPEDVKGEIKEKLLTWLHTYLKRISDQSYDDNLRSQKMNLTNPKYVLRNYLAQKAIDQATKGDFSEIEKLLKIMRRPYDEQPEFQEYASKRPEWARVKAGCSMLSCSS